MKTVSVKDALEKKLGGKWKYHRPSGEWRCDDGIRTVSNVLTGMDHNGEYTGKSTKCLYYNDGRKPEWIYAL